MVEREEKKLSGAHAGEERMKPGTAVEEERKADIGIPERARAAVTEALNRLLADEFVLYAKTRNYHWNVEGPHFRELHKLFEEQYTLIEESVDDIAERVRALGHRPAASLARWVELARLKEEQATPDARAMVERLLADHEEVCRELRADIRLCAKSGDDGSMDFLTGLLEQHEKTAWMLRATLNGV